MTEVQEKPATGASSNGAAATIPAGNLAAPPAPVPPPEKRSFVHSTAFRVFIVLLFVLGTAGVVYWSYARHWEETDDAYIEGAVVSITPQVSARVNGVHILDNQIVHKGDLLVELDTTDYDVALAQANGNLAAANGMLEQSKAGVPTAETAVAQAQAELDAAQTNFQNADQDLKRYQSLDERAKSKQAEDNATAKQAATKAAVEQGKAKVASANSQVIAAQASVSASQGQVEKAKADVRGAEVKLGYCKLYAAVDGRITNKNVDPGRYVTPQQAMFDIVPNDVWVVANFKETQLEHMRPGQSVEIYVDAYPDRELHGKVQSMQAGTGSRFSVIPAENATGNYVKVVQRLPVKIVFDGDVNTDPDRPLSLGMSVQPKVRISE